MALLTLMKGQPLAYNKDNQEDKEPLFDTIDTLKGSLKVYADMMAGVQVKKDKMYAAAKPGFTTATDLADYLVRNGVPFRDAHEIVGTAVRYCVDNACDLADLPLEVFKGFSSAIGEDVYQYLTLEGSVAARKHLGGTAPEQVRIAVARLRD
jgi:argininosuccinate lyase